MISRWSPRREPSTKDSREGEQTLGPQQIKCSDSDWHFTHVSAEIERNERVGLALPATRSHHIPQMLKVNDKVLCYHGPFLYEATVLPPGLGLG
jgi:hypothetical protein